MKFPRAKFQLHQKVHARGWGWDDMVITMRKGHVNGDPVWLYSLRSHKGVFLEADLREVEKETTDEP